MAREAAAHRTLIISGVRDLPPGSVPSCMGPDALGALSSLSPSIERVSLLPDCSGISPSWMWCVSLYKHFDLLQASPRISN